MKALFPAITGFFNAALWGSRLLRNVGAMGTPDDPVYFAAKDVVPWWMACRWPMGSDFWFWTDCETFWEDGQQHLYPLVKLSEPYLVHFDPHGQPGLIVMGNLCFYFEPRRRPPQQARGLYFAGAA